MPSLLSVFSVPKFPIISAILLWESAALSVFWKLTQKFNFEVPSNSANKLLTDSNFTTDYRCFLQIFSFELLQNSANSWCIDTLLFCNFGPYARRVRYGWKTRKNRKRRGKTRKELRRTGPLAFKQLFRVFVDGDAHCFGAFAEFVVKLFRNVNTLSLFHNNP